jgi:hypothetical protein
MEHNFHIAMSTQVIKLGKTDGIKGEFNEVLKPSLTSKDIYNGVNEVPEYFCFVNS